MHWSDLFNSGASLFIVASASTKTMVPLRALAIAANCVLIAYFMVTHAWRYRCCCRSSPCRSTAGASIRC